MWAEMTSVDEGKEWLWSERIVAVDRAIMNDKVASENHAGWIAHVFEHETRMATKRPATYGPEAREWISRRAVLFPTSWAVEVSENNYGDIRNLGLHETDQFVYGLQHEQVLACCGVLATTPTLVDAQVASSFTSMNRGRGLGRLAPVRRSSASRHPQDDPHGARLCRPYGREMPMHYRRPTFRTYRHARYTNMRGKLGAVKWAIVRADKDDEISPSPVYQVVSDKEPK